MRASRRHREEAAAAAAVNTRSKGSKAFAIYLGVLLVVIAAVWLLAWKSIASFDSKTAKTIMKGVQAEYSARSGKEITYKRIAAQVEGGITYRLLADGEDYATVNLNPLGEKGFLNMGTYTLGEIKGSKKLVFTALEGADVTVDGKALSELSTSGEAMLLPGLERLAAHPTNKTVAVPKYNTYLCDGLFEQPKLTLNGAEPVIYGDGNLLVSQVDEKTKADITKFITDFTKRYSLFTIAVRDFSAIKGDLLYTSPIYNNLRSGEYHWFPKVNSYEFTEFDMSEFVKYSDNLYSVRMKYSMHVVSYSYTSDYPTDLIYFLYNNAGKWQVVEMKVN